MPEDPRLGVPALWARNLTRTFGEGGNMTTALAEVCLELRRGEIVLLMGPSGSGKSTLLAVLSGLLRPTSGQVWALGHDLWNMSDRQRERFRLQHCGFIFQGYNLFPALTAREQLEIVVRWGEGAGAREARKRANQTLALLGLAGKAHLRPAQLSGGEKQRVAAGRALIKKPAFCFADEPTGALDWANGEQVMELLRSLTHEHGTTMLIVAHDARIGRLADRVLQLEDGRLCEPEEAPVHPSHAAASNPVARCVCGRVQWTSAPSTIPSLKVTNSEARVAPGQEREGLRAI
jgi:putative ABC transport system ATP-binding protein